MHNGWWVTNAFECAANMSSNNAFSRKQSHLRVIGDRTPQSLMGRQVLNPFWETPTDLIQRQKLDVSPQTVTEGLSL